MNRLIIEGNNYRINPLGKKPFLPKNVDYGMLQAVTDFAYRMCFGDGHHRAYRTGGSMVRRAGETFCNTFQGKLAEVCLRREFIQAGCKCDEPNFDVYGEGVWDDSDLMVNGFSVSVKSAAYFSNLLLLECHDYDSEGRYVPNINVGGTSSFDYYILIRISPDIKGLFKQRRLMYVDTIPRNEIDGIVNSVQWQYDVAGWITHSQLKEDVIGTRCIIPRGGMLNYNTRMDADNYYVHAADMSPFSEISISL